MKNNTIWKSEYFCGNKISDYGLKNGYVDYGTLAKSFDAVLNNNILEYAYSNYLTVELVNGYIDNIEEEQNKCYEIFQYYIIDDNGYNILKEYTNETIYYIASLDLYIWGVTHYGTSWSYVLTDIKIEVV